MPLMAATLVLGVVNLLTQSLAAGGPWAVGILVSLASLGVGIAFIVVFLVWFHRVYTNLAARGVHGGPSAGWAIGCWFIPVANFFLPLRPMRFAWDANRPSGERGGNGIVIGWSVAWVAYNLLTLAAAIVAVATGFSAGFEAARTGAPVDEEALSQNPALVGLQVLGLLVTIAAGILVLALARRIESWQAAHAAGSR